MEIIKLYQIDAFTDKLFKGNPAAVCILNEWKDDKLMQSIAAENNLAETAFIVKKQLNLYEIRWFTPTVEVDLCGHATLAAAFVIFNYLDVNGGEILFYTLRSGVLIVTKKENLISLDFPADEFELCSSVEEIVLGIGTSPLEMYKGKSDYMVVLEKEEDVKKVVPEFEVLSKVKSRGIIVTAPGDSVDFVSRFFAPLSGINEDPVTGSAHTTLIPYWAKKLHKKELIAHQISERGGVLFCIYKDSRVIISGNAVLYLKGEILLTENKNNPE
ncbi:MAG: PhzF family phenazine biosynthesis protein [Bacteroidota bacterium]|nr:PhzF family phenazine biosynthesis protein [Bacteroidota bacterium]